MRPPSNIKVTLIEEDTALVSWKLPDELNVPVTRYTILYASRNDWIAGEWQVMEREGKEKLRTRAFMYRCVYICMTVEQTVIWESVTLPLSSLYSQNSPG